MLTSDMARIVWNQPIGETGCTYNLRYAPLPSTNATVTLEAHDVWGDYDESGYQMLLDADATAYGTIIPTEGPLTTDGDAPDGLYDNFEYKIPNNADGLTYTENIVYDGSVTMEIPAGTYDWVITNPTPYDRIWIASSNGNIPGRYNDFTFEAGKHYKFVLSLHDEGNDGVDLTVETLISTDWNTVNGIGNSYYSLNGLTENTTYMVQVQTVYSDDITSGWSSDLIFNTDHLVIPLADAEDNTAIIYEFRGKEADVTLADRTLWKDGGWNTICLPFSVTIDDSVLDGATAMELCSSSFANGTLTLNFTQVTTLEAGKPYIIKWEGGDNLVNPQFKGVTMSQPTLYDKTTECVTFKGTYAPVNFTDGDRTKLFMGESSTLYYPESNAYINALRCYFQLADGLHAGGVDSNVKAFVLKFDDSTTGIERKTWSMDREEIVYDLSGRKLNKQKVSPGIYIVNGKKVLIK